MLPTKVVIHASVIKISRNNKLFQMKKMLLTKNVMYSSEMKKKSKKMGKIREN